MMNAFTNKKVDLRLPAWLLLGLSALALLAGCSVSVPAAEVQATVESSEPVQAVEEAAAEAVATVEGAAQDVVDAAQAGLEGAVEGAVEGAQEGAQEGIAAAQAVTPTVEAAADAPQADAPRLYAADPARSEVRFLIDEVLMGQDKTVVGRGNGVEATVTVDPAAPTQAQVGPVRVDARTLETDDSFRNRAIRSQILQANRDEFQFITFTPTALEGIPEQVAVGEPFDFTITGDLQIREMVAPVTFAATATPVSQDEIGLAASATVQREMFDLRIPRVPGVARVGEDVTLELDLVLVAQ